MREGFREEAIRIGALRSWDRESFLSRTDLFS